MNTWKKNQKVNEMKMILKNVDLQIFMLTMNRFAGCGTGGLCVCGAIEEYTVILNSVEGHSLDVSIKRECPHCHAILSEERGDV